MISSKSTFFILFALFFGSVIHSAAQERCGTVAYEKLRNQLHPNRETTDQFEQWMKVKLGQLKLSKLGTGDRAQSTVYTIPVVVHVIHNGEAIGTGTNVSDAQVLSQIDVINNDYPRLNADSVNTPGEFKPAAGTINVHFVLAKQDPEGLPTNGIVRVKGTKTGWTLADNSTFKALSYWPAENYLNIWVVKFVDPSGIIGYAQLPISTLPGLEKASDDRLTDGVAIDYRAFGSGNFPNLYSQFNKGRTATHEIGHIFGLRHIWGDVNDCTGTDYVNDTPPQDASTRGCPAQPQAPCSVDKMFQNYMDYTDDPCMNIFTKDQIDRMVTVLGNSPRRASLLVSPGATDPVSVANDLGVRSIVAPTKTACPTTTAPAVEVRNYGNNTVSSARIQLTVNGVTTETKDFSLSMAYKDTAVAFFSPLTLAPSTTNVFRFHILLTNGGTDGKVFNDTLSQTVVVAARAPVPLVEEFNSLPTTWSVVNPDRLTTWQNGTAPYLSATNKAMYMDFYDYETQGEQDQLVTPVLDLSNDTAAVLKFDRSYATLSGGDLDQLRVLVSTGCDFSHAVEIFNKSGTALATASSTSSAFVPKTASDWKTETISLNQFLGQPNVQVAFVSTNDYGNNLYLDNVRIVTGSYSDLALVALKTPSPVICITQPTPVVTVRNNGSSIISTITISASVNSGTVGTQSFSGLHMDTGQEQDFTLSAWSLNAGNNVIRIAVLNPADANDVNPDDNTLNLNEVVNTSLNTIPLRQNFDGSYPDWTIVSAASQMKWVATSTNRNTSLEYNAFANSTLGNQAWIVSPVLDFSRALKSSLFFDISYAKSTTGNDHLQVLSSTDCGMNFSSIVLDQTGDQLASTSPSNSSWKPQLTADWKRQYVSLDALIGKTGNQQSRLAFVVTNDHGNNLYIDNVEFFLDDNPDPASISSDHLVYYNSDRSDPQITFNLPEKETVRLQIFNTLGQLVSDDELPDILNQTYHFDMAGKPGVYVVRIQIGNQLSSTKVFIPN